MAAWLPPDWPTGAQVALTALGAVLSLLGALGAAWAFVALGRALTPFPEPHPRARLVERGPYALVRHPTYAAGILFFAGFALATSPATLVPLALLVVLWRNKAAFEEELLARRYPEYADYRERVRGAFVPRSLPAED